ncbi:MAG: hypothetical protein LBU29_00695 [Endomicrobium sp.]|jgi:hypothetical protein|nr:hypothetical protein [Endomicrobium sp.]
MSTDRLVKWSKESAEFFEKAEDNSIVLDLVISYACASQTGEGFEELVNTINSEKIKRKIKKVNITDTSYLYRYNDPQFEKYVDPTIPTKWFLNNREVIEKLEVLKEVKSWASMLDTNRFRKWQSKIMLDFFGDEKGGNTNIEFRNEVLREANLRATRSGCMLRQSLNFILEKCIHACAYLNDAVICYPGKPRDSLTESMRLNGYGFVSISYKISERSQKKSKLAMICGVPDVSDVINREIVSFMKEKVSNVNFFVVDKKGDPIYINYALEKIVKDKHNVKEVDPEAWDNSILVIKEQKQIISEETSPSGNRYLSVKSPLIINDKVEGVIGLAVDITEKKRAEELQKKLEIQEEVYKMAKEVASEVDSPVTALKMIEYMSRSKLSEKEWKILKMAIESIETVANTLSGLKMVSSRGPAGCELPEEERRQLDASIANVKTIANTLLQKCIEVSKTN